MIKLNNKTIWIGLGVLVAVGAAGLFLMYGKSGSSNVYNSANVANPTSVPTAAAVQPSGSDKSAKEVTVEASEFKLSPSTINLKVGEKVSLTFKNTGAASHNFTIPGLQVATKTIGSG
ncbi:cupredoxin domain-containing protein, partial [Candidatus Woesebacteria bacterium]|nr:cupredoxin domain-containing protein [Candidatus Woesebacteria bacterium]